MSFDYQEAFSRNLGWVTRAEQARLRGSRVAIAGLGGVGGSHLTTLARLGVGAFSIADFDRFELPNFNRQAGASVDTLGREKLEVMSAAAAAINPEVDVRRFPTGVTEGNLDEFLDDVDIYVDSLDFFALDIRARVFAACREKGIPAVTAAPLGMGSALLCFMPDSMSFEQYFRMDGKPDQEKALRFMLGLAPSSQHMAYLVENAIDMEARKGPSTAMGCELCAGFAGSYVLKILLGRGEVLTAPYGIHFDAYRNRVTTTWRPWGNNNPLQRIGLAIARKRVMGDSSLPAQPERERVVERVLDLARWAPSGDNEPPWRFEIPSDTTFTVYGHDTRDWCVYDLDGTSSQIAIGAMLETAAIAASGEGMRLDWTLREQEPEEKPVIDVTLTPDESVTTSTLEPFITTRTTQRLPFTQRALSAGQKKQLEDAVGEGYRVLWIEGDDRKPMAKLLFHNAHIRLSTPEAHAVHQKNIEWGARFSEDRLPEYALGIDAPTRKVMRFALGSWQRVKFLNRFFAGTWLPRLQMDLRTGRNCAAHFVILAEKAPTGLADYFAAGAAMQRFWLCATGLGLQFQPEMTPLIFSRYVREGLRFTVVAAEQELAGQLAGAFNDLVPADHEPAQRVYMGRVGFGPAPTSRSIRPPLEKLLVQPG